MFILLSKTALLLHYVLTPKSLWVSDYGEVGLTRAFYCTELLGSPDSNKKERRRKLVIYDGMINGILLPKLF